MHHKILHQAQSGMHWYNCFFNYQSTPVFTGRHWRKDTLMLSNFAKYNCLIRRIKVSWVYYWMLNNFSNYSCAKMYASTKITKNKQNWKKQKIEINILKSKYSVVLFFFLSALLNNKNFLMMWSRKSVKKNIFDSAKQMNSTSAEKQRGKTKNTAQTEQQRKIHHGRISWKEWSPFITQMARHVREAKRDGTSEGDADGYREIYRQRCVRCGGETEEQWRGGEIIGWKRMREGWSFYFWAEHSSQAEFILVGSHSPSPHSLCLYFLHPARATNLIPLKSQTGFPTQKVLY